MGRKTTSNLGTFWYRVKKYPRAAIFSVLLVFFIAFAFSFFLGKVYPEFKLADKLLSFLGFQHNENFNFYTGQPNGAYWAIGEAVEQSSSRDKHFIHNHATSGGSENAMRLTTELNSFGFIQEEMINHDDQLKKNVRIISPIFLERMHIFYRKEIFQNCESVIQLSTNTDRATLNCISKYVRNVNLGPVGSGTRIMASYILALLDRQFNNNRIAPPKYQQNEEGLSSALDDLWKYTEKTDSTYDLVFYVGADPIDMVKRVLDLGKYNLMSINPSFVVALNKEFDLGLRLADFKNKYDSAKNISTIGTYALLITSRKTHNADVLTLLKKIDACKGAIHKELIHLPNSCDDSCYSFGVNSPYQLPLHELGFFNAFKGEYHALRKIEGKEIAALILSIVTLFFPVFKSVSSFSSKLRTWSLNREVDDAVGELDRMDYRNHPLIILQTHCTLFELKRTIIDLYGDGQLTEDHFNPLNERVKMYLEKFPLSISSAGEWKVRQ